MSTRSELTPRELAVMQVFWAAEVLTAEDARSNLADSGERLSYPTVANVVRGLVDKGYLRARNDRRPFQYEAVRSFREVSTRIVGDLITRLFSGSREEMLINLLDRHKLTCEERAYLTSVLEQRD